MRIYRFKEPQTKQLNNMQIISRVVLITLFLLLVALAKMNAQSSRGLSPFDGISVFGNFEVVLEAGTEDKATVYAGDIDEDKINIFVKQGTLKIQMSTPNQLKHDQVKVVVTYQELRKIRAQAGARIYGKEIIQTDNIYIKAASGGRVELDLQVEALEADATEGGVVELGGFAKIQRLGANTGGQFDGYHLEGERVYAKAGTGGSIRANASESIDAAANTGGTIEYKGDPKEKNTRTVFGDIRKI